MAAAAAARAHLVHVVGVGHDAHLLRLLHLLLHVLHEVAATVHHRVAHHRVDHVRVGHVRVAGVRRRRRLHGLRLREERAADECEHGCAGRLVLRWASGGGVALRLAQPWLTRAVQNVLEDRAAAVRPSKAVGSRRCSASRAGGRARRVGVVRGSAGGWVGWCEAAWREANLELRWLRSRNRRSRLAFFVALTALTSWFAHLAIASEWSHPPGNS